MGLKHFLLGTSLLCGLVISPALSHAADGLSPRAEVSVKAGSERSTLTTEFWAPLAQKSDRVVYTDLRLMGDDDDNREGNLGIGYRQIYTPTNSVLGIHGWIDRRRTEHNSTFHQVTLGVESLGDKLDLRVNGYVPLNDGRVVTTPNLGSATPYLAGNGLFFDTNGSINETPQYGLDAEAGYRLPLFEKQIDTLRVYGGGYHFFRSNTENVTGFRMRTEAQINQIVSVGARFQHDGPRGSQGFLEATLRFPFSAKKLYQRSGLVSRLDESPERDIDIVTASKVDNGLHKEILNAIGAQQRILYVDNTQTNGDGTKEHPFNNLQSAQQALQANDILYIFRGDGTTHNMDQGITIDKPNVTLIGSGSALTVSGYTFLNAGTAPIITNTQTATESTPGSGLYITGNGIYANGGGDINISGITVNAASAMGISAVAIPGINFSNISVTNVTSTNNLIEGISIGSQGGNIGSMYIANNTVQRNSVLGVNAFAVSSGHVDSITIENNNVTSNNNNGIVPQAYTNATIGTIIVRKNDTSNTTGRGIISYARTGAQINSLTIENNISNNNTVDGIAVSPANTDSTIRETFIRNNLVSNNLGNGINYIMGAGGKASTLLVENNTANNNNANGLTTTVDGANTSIDSISLNNNIANNNTLVGYIGVTSNNGNVGLLSVQNLTTSNNISDGVRVTVITGGAVNQVVANNITATGNRYGVYVNPNHTTINSVELSSISTANNTLSGVFVYAQNQGVIGQAKLNAVSSINNTQYGVYVFADGAGSVIGRAELTNTISNNNKFAGVYLQANLGGLLSQSVITNATITNNLQNGLFIRADGTNATMDSIVATNVTSTNNGQNGVQIYDNNTGIINSIALSQITASNNTQNGIYFQQSATGSVLNNGSLSFSNATGNTLNGVVVQKSNATGTFQVSLGGGLSAGQNRIFGNTGNDLNIDRATVSASSNWWNNGGAAPTRVTLTNGGTATYTPLLATDPRP